MFRVVRWMVGKARQRVATTYVPSSRHWRSLDNLCDLVIVCGLLISIYFQANCFMLRIETKTNEAISSIQNTPEEQKGNIRKQTLKVTAGTYIARGCFSFFLSFCFSCAKNEHNVSDI